MNIALIAHDKKKELMVQFCIAYKGIFEKHNLIATGTTGGLIYDATGLDVHKLWGDYKNNLRTGDEELLKIARKQKINSLINREEYYALWCRKTSRWMWKRIV